MWYIPTAPPLVAVVVAWLAARAGVGNGHHEATGLSVASSLPLDEGTVAVGKVSGVTLDLVACAALASLLRSREVAIAIVHRGHHPVFLSAELGTEVAEHAGASVDSHLRGIVVPCSPV